MNSSLEKLVQNLLDDDFKHLTQQFGSENLKLLKQKDVCSYEYMDSFERFFENALPDKKFIGLLDCYRSLKNGRNNDKSQKLDGHITDEESVTCIKIWNRFNMKKMVDYHDHYLKRDVLLLADVFEKLTSGSLKFYKLDPCHYFSSPG